jgi:SAM-dependent methyltransferase
VSSTVEPEYYDVAMTEEGAPSMLPLEESPWLPLYEEAAGWIPYNHAVVDLGTGTGRFPHMLRCRERYGHITGIDFSPSAISQARFYLRTNNVEAVDLEVCDLRVWLPAADRDGATTYVCLEVLEHLFNDIDLVRRIPPGHQFVFSVPNYESESHARVFRNAGDVWARYADLLTFRRWSLVKVDDRKSIHVVDAVRRTDSW